MLYKLIETTSNDCDHDQVFIAAEHLSEKICQLRRNGWEPVGNHTVTVITPTTYGPPYVMFTQMMKKPEEKDFFF